MDLNKYQSIRWANLAKRSCVVSLLGNGQSLLSVSHNQAEQNVRFTRQVNKRIAGGGLKRGDMEVYVAFGKRRTRSNVAHP